MNVVVTGGSRGIGQAIVIAAARAGHDVVFGYHQDADAAARTCARVAELAPERVCRPLQIDQRDSQACDDFAHAAREQLGDIRAVVCNAGINRDHLAYSMDDASWRDVIDTNLSGSFYVARAFLGDLLASGEGRLVFVSSIVEDGASGQANYAASKAGLIGLSKSLAKEYGCKGLTSNVITPGMFETDMTVRSLPDSRRTFWGQFCPLRRMGRPEEVAHAVLFLCSPEASFINGAVVPVTGGLGWSP